MNSCCFIAKIISTPKQRIILDDISLVETHVQVAKIRKRKTFDKFQIALWGKLGKEFIKYYRVGDYVIIKGILSFTKKKIGNRSQKETKFTVRKVYPFVLADHD
jgi:single-stranded DNA-binding protein